MNEVSEILSSPFLPDIFRQIQEQLEKERKKREEFLSNIDEDSSAEFINGEIVYHSPVSWRHSQASGLLYRLLSFFVDKYDLGEVHHERVMLHFPRNNYEPDIAFWTKEKAKNFKPGQLLFPPPDFVVEIISPSTEENDRGVKFIDYAFNEVGEYWIIDPEAETIEQYLNKGREFYLAKKFITGDFIRSFVIKGFKIPVSAVFYKEENLRILKML